MTLKSTCLGLFTAAVMATAMCGTAHAGLIGDQIQFSDNFGDATTTEFVSPEASFGIFGGSLNAIVGDDTLTVNNSGCGGGCYVNGGDGVLQFVDLTRAPIADVTIASITDVTGFSASDITFTANSITLTLPNGTTFGSTDSDIVLDIATVPEPASLAMFGTGILAISFLGWRRRKSGSVI